MPLPNIPSSIKEEHKELHNELAATLNMGGNTAKAAEELVNILHPHFEAEEEFAMPELGVLIDLSQGKMDFDVQAVVELSDKLKAEMPKMLEEHKQIASAAQHLKEVALSENKPEAAKAAEKLILHAKNEEEVLYPAAILVGETLKSRK